MSDRSRAKVAGRGTSARAAVKSPSRSVLTILLVVIALAGALRAIDLGRQSLWYDEGVSAYLTSLSLGDLTQWTAQDIQPPLYYYLLWGWARIFGSSEAALRALSLVFSLLTVPLSWYAGQRLLSVRAGLLSALFFATSPLYIWYAQEARNYALLTFLGLLSSIILYRLVEQTSSPAALSDDPGEGTWPAPFRGARLWMWMAYAAISSAALYTHYFAAFLLAFQVAYAATVWIKQGRPARTQWRFGGAWLVIAASYLPWLPHMIGRFGQDESYWQGALKIGEALRKLLISFSLGESVLESAGYPLAVGFLILLGLCLAALLLWRDPRSVAAAIGRRQRSQLAGRPVLFLVLYLLVPLAGVLILSIWTPKFNPRYLMLASPPFLLLLAGGIDALISSARLEWRALPRMLQLGLAGAAMGFIFGSFFYADRNIYADPAFTKADFRGVTTYLQAHRTGDEAIILVSGHMFPVFDYYLPGAERLRLPADRTLSTSHILDFDVADTLNAEVAGKAGVWVVRWQDEIVDPNGVLSMLLDTAGEKMEVDAAFWHIGLDYYRLPADARFPTGPQIEHRQDVNFGNTIQLLGWSQPRPDEYLLYWQALNAIAEDVMVSLRLVDAQGHVWGQVDRRPAAYLYPMTRWSAGEAVFGRGVLPAQAGTPPGMYWMELRVYSTGQPDGFDLLDAAGAPQGRMTRLGPFALNQAGRTFDAGSISVAQSLDCAWAASVELRGAGALPESVAVGESLVVELMWHAIQPTGHPLQVHLQAVAPKERMVHRIALSLFSDYPSTAWQAGEWLRSKDTWQLPASWPTGDTRVQLIVADSSGPLDPVVDVGSIVVTAPERTFALSATLDVRVDQSAGDLARLMGLSIDSGEVRAGERFTVTLFWQPLGETQRSYTVFVHLLDASGRRVAQYDRVPVNGARPTTGWIANEVIADSYVFDAPAAGGNLSLAIGLYDASVNGFPRLTWHSDGGVPTGDVVRVSLPTSD